MTPRTAWLLAVIPVLAMLFVLLTAPFPMMPRAVWWGLVVWELGGLAYCVYRITRPN